TARLLAKALNCTGDRSALPPGEPCNACPSCVEITRRTSMYVVELDAASNRGVGEMRTLLERVAYRSAGGARKVYIVDEVHMLTKEASTALLKTLEEPPDHVIFVLATTDPQMVLPTIRSRTQHFEFSLLPAERLAAHLADIAVREGVDADPEALATIARRAAWRPPKEGGPHWPARAGRGGRQPSCGRWRLWARRRSRSAGPRIPGSSSRSPLSGWPGAT